MKIKNNNVPNTLGRVITHFFKIKIQNRISSSFKSLSFNLVKNDILIGAIKN